MIVKDAPWEKRNLGVDAVIFQVSQEDRIEDVVPILMACKTGYQEMHIPSGNTDVLLAAQSQGFSVIEMSIEVQTFFENQEKSFQGIYNRFKPHMSYSFANADEFEMIIESVETGEMFLTDKFSRNPRFGMRVSGRRYANWLKQIRNEKSVIVIVKYKGQNIGFHSYISLGNHEYMGVLGGVFPEYEKKGLGISSLYEAHLALVSLGAKKLITHVSSNNMPILKCLLMSDFKVIGAEYVLFRTY